MCSVYSVCIMSPTHNLSSKIGSEREAKSSPTEILRALPSVHLLCRTCVHSVASVPPELWHLHRYICYEERVCTLWCLYLESYVIWTVLWRTSMHSVAFVPPELWHLHRYICYEERVCSLWHLYLQSYDICTDTSVVKNVSALCGICTFIAVSSAQIK